MKRSLQFSPYLILLLGFCLRLYHLGADSLWYDETVSLYLARSDPFELIRHTAGDIHPPLYYLLLSAWGRLAGFFEFAAAFFSLGFGVLLIALVYRITRNWYPARLIAPLAALFVALSPFNIWYSQEVRMYTLGATLGLLSVYFLRRLVARDKILTRDFFAYVLVTAAGIYSLYYFIFLLVFQWLWVILRTLSTLPTNSAIRNQKSEIPSLKSFFFSQLTVAFLYLCWLPIAFRQATDPPVPPWREFIDLPRVILESSSALAFGQSVDPNVFGIVALLFLVPIAIVIWREWRAPRPSLVGAHENQSAISNQQSAIHDSPSALFLLGYTFVPLGAIYLLSLWKPLYHVRYLFTYSPAFYILAAFTVVNLAAEFARARLRTTARRVYGLGAVLMLAALGFLALTGYSLYNFWENEQYQSDDLRGAVQYIAERWRPGDAVLVNAGYVYPALAYYFPESLPRERLTDYSSGSLTQPILLTTGSIGGGDHLGWGDPLSDFYPTTADETRAALERVLRDHPRVWMLRIYDTVVDPNGDIRAFFDQNSTLFDDRAFGGESQARVQGFMAHSTIAPEAARVADVPFADRVLLTHYQLREQDLERGSNLDVVLYWKLLQTVNHNYQVSLQLLDGRDNNLAQSDEMPLSDLLPMTRWNVGETYRQPMRLHIPTDVTPGGYRVIVKLYDPRSGEVIGPPIVELGQVQIHP
ncbi:MAG: glycosyltransferase family 39 protein [Anaerolineae bacterium]|nr:glycosyltransferase family 39 protein [Anaerolineae bacterium]